MTFDDSLATPLPGAIRAAWQVLASAAHTLDAQTATYTDLVHMLAISEVMDTLVDVNPPYPPISLGEHSPHTPRQAARRALTELDDYTPAPSEAGRVLRARRLLHTIVNGGRGRTS